jgi:hypothetical protein
MDRVRALRQRSAHQRDRVQVALLSRRVADADRAVGEADRQRIAVGLGICLHGFDAELAARANDAHGDLTPIRNQDAADRLRHEALNASGGRNAIVCGPAGPSRA